MTLGHEGEPARRTAELATLAETAGLDLIGVADSQSIYRECFTQLTAVALATTRIRLGPLVTNPVTRHPAVLAGAIATLDELSGGRAYLALGNGASAVANAGLAPARPAELRSAAEVIARLLRGAAGQEPPRLTWVSSAIPLLVHASRPDGLRAAADTSDGVLLRWGDVAADALAGRIAELRRLRAAGPLAGRPFSVWIYGSGWIGDRDAAAGHIGSWVAARAVTVREAELPEVLRDAWRSYRERYDYSRHASGDDPFNARLLESVGLAEVMADRFAITGQASDVAEVLTKLAGSGVDAFVFGGAVSEKPALIEGLAVVRERVAAAGRALPSKTIGV